MALMTSASAMKIAAQVAPVAEEANVRIGIHPNDPPVEELGGNSRCIFSEAGK